MLLVEDDASIARALARQLGRWGYKAQVVEDFQAVLEQFHSFCPDLVLLDLSLPFFSGFYWCNEIRRESHVPILFISSASDDMNQVMALSAGGDDFIAKPFSLELAIAKIQATLRRAYDFGPESAVLRAGEAVLQLGQAVLSYQQQEAQLSRNEFIILKVLMERKGQPVSREEIIRHLWEDENYIDDNTLTVNIARLRKKLEGMGLVDFVKTRKGLGYLVEG